ncbi:hypothetical protein Cme02nite_48080 [Catellatospora methionotrophica]|uniref:HTH luxR-type domain-containing protein n=1 Tax=Catellatospora methionotrophica TaxID=121620 RepID=A0A8J3LJQ7_9ACTN|nr:response regulator transcription factor [Catellatospora methionotrophica]GIG16476.1 hypothetical protein Cme02nite_48080 [Catellatospora methionotrophica]
MTGWEGRVVRPAAVAQPGAPRMLVVASRPDEIAALVGSAAAVTAQLTPADLLPGRPLAVPDLVLLHSAQPLRDLGALGRLLAHVPCLLIARSAAADTVACLRAGATSVLVEGQFTRWELLDAVHATTHGQSRLSPAAVADVVAHLRRGDSAPPPARPDLSRRDREIMELLVAGESNGQIAVRLALAEKTVRNRVSRIYGKLGARNRAQAVVSWLEGRPSPYAPVSRSGGRSG